MRPTILIIATFISVAAADVALAQATGNPSPEEGATCPPDIKGEPPTVGGGSSAPLTDKLARSKGVICPPAGIDRDTTMFVTLHVYIEELIDSLVDGGNLGGP